MQYIAAVQRICFQPYRSIAVSPISGTEQSEYKCKSSIRSRRRYDCQVIVWKILQHPHSGRSNSG